MLRPAGLRLNGIGVILSALAVATGVLALLTDPRPGDDLIGRLSSPALGDRRPYTIRRQTVRPDGSVEIAGTIPGTESIRGMWWFVNGSPATVQSLQHEGNGFTVVLRLPPARERWTVFAIASMGDVAHYVPMREPVFVSRASTNPGPQTQPFRITAPGRAIAALDYAVGDASPVALGGLSTLRWLSGAQISLTGWAIDLGSKRAPSAVFVGFDRAYFRAASGGNRPDVAKAYANRAYLHAGFVVNIPSTFVRPGSHRLVVYVRSRNGALQPSNVKLIVFVATM